MILLTDDLRDRLLANGRQSDVDHVPVVKFFNPVGAGTWLITEMEPDGDTLFGLADLGFGCPEMGSCSLAEFRSISLPFGLGIERDILFEGLFPLSVYAEAARLAGSIVESERLLRAAAASLRNRQ
ncbi:MULTISPECIES: DUF2958 domain-containing protein [Actibacterium]|uniref:Single-stranded DNA endonuclease n=1 Tax=Actibacterium naphthalenivorans TaxID=1614693 RepID=A0A840CDN0_9RHOB|nr:MULTISPECIES: DUF2958 domain-containing protein [Actibacterium]ALG91515.1 single-stranded DNA endonuclease [Actibacterium sp. EMB200-NS6]MBB4024211.1 hypothetical protein [Actibacterium naphthalenivorans]